eukprot:365057-Chlamydomonas_euryale.AAC.29
MQISAMQSTGPVDKNKWVLKLLQGNSCCFIQKVLRGNETCNDGQRAKQRAPPRHKRRSPSPLAASPRGALAASVTQSSSRAMPRTGPQPSSNKANVLNTQQMEWILRFGGFEGPHPEVPTRPGPHTARSPHGQVPTRPGRFGGFEGPHPEVPTRP